MQLKWLKIYHTFSVLQGLSATVDPCCSGRAVVAAGR